MLVIHIHKDKAGAFRWRAEREGHPRKVLAMSPEGYPSEESARTHFNVFKRGLMDEAGYEVEVADE